ncbi:hypothetical protein NECID01_2116, partial [Nematocida sp. AWRm77]
MRKAYREWKKHIFLYCGVAAIIVGLVFGVWMAISGNLKSAVEIGTSKPSNLCIERGTQTSQIESDSDSRSSTSSTSNKSYTTPSIDQLICTPKKSKYISIIKWIKKQIPEKISNTAKTIMWGVNLSGYISQCMTTLMFKNLEELFCNMLTKLKYFMMKYLLRVEKWGRALEEQHIQFQPSELIVCNTSMQMRKCTDSTTTCILKNSTLNQSLVTDLKEISTYYNFISNKPNSPRRSQVEITIVDRFKKIRNWSTIDSVVLTGASSETDMLMLLDGLNSLLYALNLEVGQFQIFCNTSQYHAAILEKRKEYFSSLKAAAFFSVEIKEEVLRRIAHIRKLTSMRVQDQCTFSFDMPEKNSIDMGYIRCLLLSSVSETEIRRLHNYIVFPFLQELEVCDCTIEKVSSIFAQDSKYRRVRVLSLRRVRLLFKIDLGFPNWMENLKLLTLEKIGFVEDQDYGTAKMERYLETFKVDVFLWSKYTFPEFDSAEYVKDKQASSRAIKITGIQYVDSRQREQEKEITFAINSITHTLMVFSHWNNCTQDLVPVLKNIKLPFCSSRYANIKRLEWLSHNIGTDGVLESRYLKILVSAYGKDLDSFVFMDAKTNLLKSKELKTEITVESMLQYTSS